MMPARGSFNDVTGDRVRGATRLTGKGEPFVRWKPSVDQVMDF
jgi:hypothetical protein